MINHLFVDNHGEPIESIRTAWRTATRKAGLPALRVHDMRRSAVTNSRQAEIPESVRMASIGHASRAQHDAYDQINLRDQADAARRLQGLYEKALTAPESAPEKEATS